MHYTLWVNDQATSDVLSNWTLFRRNNSNLQNAIDATPHTAITRKKLFAFLLWVVLVWLFPFKIARKENSIEEADKNSLKFSSSERTSSKKSAIESAHAVSLCKTSYGLKQSDSNDESYEMFVVQTCRRAGKSRLIFFVQNQLQSYINNVFVHFRWKRKTKRRQ